MPVTDPFTVACPSCGTHFDVTDSSVEVDFADFGAATARCPTCGTSVPVRRNRKRSRRAGSVGVSDRRTTDHRAGRRARS
jgi:predicted Zn finger-like uncharacterized protein